MAQRALHFNFFFVTPTHPVFAWGAAMHFCRCAAEVLWSQPSPSGGCWAGSVTGRVPEPGGEADQQLSWGLAENSFLLFFFFFPWWKQEEALAGRRLMLCHKIVFSPLSAVRVKPLAGPSPGCGQHLLSQLVIKPMFSLMIMRRMNMKLLQLIADFPITNSLLKGRKSW